MFVNSFFFICRLSFKYLNAKDASYAKERFLIVKFILLRCQYKHSIIYRNRDVLIVLSLFCYNVITIVSNQPNTKN